MLNKLSLVSGVLTRTSMWLVAIMLVCAFAPVHAQSLDEARELIEARRFYAASMALTSLVEAQTLDAADLAQAYSLRGQSQFQRSRLAEARADYQRALELDSTLALAAFGLGRAERNGWGSAPDPERARALLKQAADAGIAEAVMELGILYLSSSPRELEQGLAALREAAELGVSMAAHTLGEFYRMGTLVNADPQEAFRWHLQAAEQGQAAAMFRVSMAYRGGNGVAVDTSAAELWLQRALDQGYSEAMHFAGYTFELQGDMVQANQHYWAAAQAGHKPAQINLGISWLMGNRGVQQDYGKAYYWLARASGAPLADFYRARMLEYGRGVASNLPAAYAAYESAARVSLPEAKAHLALFLDIGRGVNADQERAAEYFAEFAGYEAASDLNSVAWALATHPEANAAHIDLALELAKRATALSDDPGLLDTLAAAYAARGESAQAISVLQQAVQAVDDATLAAEFETHLASYRMGQRWIDDLAPVASNPGLMAGYPQDTTVFTGEVLSLAQGGPGNAATIIDLDPGNSNWVMMVRVGHVEAGKLPQHLQEVVYFFMHSPTELFARLPGNASILSLPQGEHRFTLSMQALDYDLAMGK